MIDISIDFYECLKPVYFTHKYGQFSYKYKYKIDICIDLLQMSKNLYISLIHYYSKNVLKYCHLEI